MSDRTSALWGLCPFHSTTSLDHPKQGIGYGWPCAILGWLVTYRLAPLEEALSINWSHHSVIWFFSPLLHDHVASWKVWKRAFKMLPLWLSACACLWGGGSTTLPFPPPRHGNIMITWSLHSILFLFIVGAASPTLANSWSCSVAACCIQNKTLLSYSMKLW